MAYEKKNLIPIGVPGAPWPSMSEEHVNNKQSFELGVMEDADNPMMLYSALSYAEVMGMLYRGMPVPSMLPAFEFVVSRTNPNNLNRIANLISDPGTGKSYLATLIGKARDPRGPIVTDAGGKNLEYLLFQTVFDTEESRPLTKAIDDGLANGSLDEVCLNALRKFGKHFSEKEGRYSVDWRGLSTDEKIESDDIRQVLELVRTVQRWDASKMGVGFKTKKGPLVIAHEEGRDIVIDELNKCKPGSEGPLQEVWQVLNGEIEEHTVTLGSNGTFTFKRGKGGSVICTGNLPKDGVGTHLISESFDSRVPRFRVPNFDERDWQHRICQKLTGLPISTLHSMQKGSWQDIDGKRKWVIDDPDGFTKLLFTLRSLQEKQEVPDWQLSMIANWQNVIDASDRLATFYQKWSELVDTESPSLKGGSLPDILAEVDNPENPTSKVTARTMIRNINDALEIKPVVKKMEQSGGFDFTRNWNTPLQINVLEKDPIESKLGTRLSKVIMEEIYRISSQEGKKHLYGQLTQCAKDAGLLGPDPTIAKLLNVDPMKVQGSTAQAKRMQDILTAFLRAEYPQHNLSASNEDILPLQQVKKTMEEMAMAGELKYEISPFTTALTVPNADLETVEELFFRRVGVDNKQTDESLEEARTRLPARSLLSNMGLLTALAMPNAGGMNLKGLWNRALTGNLKAPDEATAMAQNQSTTGIAITSVICRKGPEDDNAQYTKLHIVHNAKLGKTLAVGESAISQELRAQLKRNGITYIDFSEQMSESIANAQIREMMDPAQEALVKEAFLMRNGIRPDLQLDTTSLASLLTKPGQTRLILPNFVTSFDPDKIPHTQRVKQEEKSRILS